MQLSTLKAYIQESDNIVFFGGAGVSTASGIPDFRSADGLYADKSTTYPPEEILSRDFFFEHTEEFYHFYFSKLLIGNNVRPNAAHIYLAELGKRGKLPAVITQNIDGLHQAAGSCNVLDLHGSIQQYQCVGCSASYNLQEILPYAEQNQVPRCTSCGQIVKPRVILYGEALDSKVIELALQAISSADLLIVGGTSLTVYPAAGLIRYFQGSRLVLINQSATAYDSHADLYLREDIAKVFAALLTEAN